MVLSNKKLKRKLRAELAETITITVSESDPNNGGPTKPDPNAKPQLSLRELIDSATQKPRLTKREKRRKKLSLEDPEAVKSRRSGGDPEEKEGGSESLVEKKKKKKRKREEEEEVKDGALDSEENGVVKEAKKSKKKKKKKKVKKKKEEGKSEEENNGAELGNEVKGVVETNKNGESQPYEEVAKKIYVGGIPYYSTEDDIQSFFESCGTITEIDCMKFPESGKFRGIAIISFKTEAAAKRALALDGADMGGLYLKIQPYKATRVIKLPDFAPKIVKGYNRIYVGNLLWDITEDELRKFFSDCNISSIRFGEDKETGEFRGYAHVDFSDSLSLTMALKLDQQIVCGRPVKISCAVPMKGAGIKSRSAHTSEVADNATSQGVDNTTNQITDNATSQVADKAEQSSVSGKIRRRTCYECGEKGHLSSACPKKQNADPTNSVDSAGRKVLCMPRQWQDRDTSPDRTKVWMEPKSKTTEQKVPVIYYLSRNGQLEQPHFMEVPLSSPKGLYLRDVMNRLNFLRGQGMANIYTWSSKRSYKNGFVWQDLSDNDFIYPCHGQEYVFKGSQLLETSLSFRSYETVSSISSTSNNSFDTGTSSIDSNIPTAIVRKKNQSWSSFDDLREYEVYKARAGGEFAAKASNAATQTEDKGRQKRKDSEEVEECEGNDVTEMKGHEEVHLAFSKNGFGGLGSLEGSEKVDVRNLLAENDCPSEKKKASKVLMQLISCGSRGIKDRL